MAEIGLDGVLVEVVALLLLVIDGCRDIINLKENVVLGWNDLQPDFLEANF